MKTQMLLGFSLALCYCLTSALPASRLPRNSHEILINEHHQSDAFTCPSWDGLYPNPDDCASFYQCSNGYAYLIECPSGLFYNPETEVCDYAMLVNCPATTTATIPTSTEKTSPIFTTDVTDVVETTVATTGATESTDTSDTTVSMIESTTFEVSTDPTETSDASDATVPTTESTTFKFSTELSTEATDDFTTFIPLTSDSTSEEPDETGSITYPTASTY